MTMEYPDTITLSIPAFGYANYIDEYQQQIQQIQFNIFTPISDPVLVESILGDFLLSIGILSCPKMCIDINVLSQKLDIVTHLPIIQHMSLMATNQEYEKLFKQKVRDMFTYLSVTKLRYKTDDIPENMGYYGTILFWCVNREYIKALSHVNTAADNTFIQRKGYQIILNTSTMNRDLTAVQMMFRIDETKDLRLDLYESLSLINYDIDCDKSHGILNLYLSNDRLRVARFSRQIFSTLATSIKDVPTMKRLLDKFENLQYIDLIPFCSMCASTYSVFMHVYDRINKNKRDVIEYITKHSLYLEIQKGTVNHAVIKKMRSLGITIVEKK